MVLFLSAQSRTWIVLNFRGVNAQFVGGFFASVLRFPKDMLNTDYPQGSLSDVGPKCRVLPDSLKHPLYASNGKRIDRARLGIARSSLQLLLNKTRATEPLTTPPLFSYIFRCKVAPNVFTPPDARADTVEYLPT